MCWIFLLILLPLTATSEQPAGQPFVIDAEKSWIRVLVFRAGVLSGLGHNHVVSSNNIEGTISLAHRFSDSTFELRIPVTKLVVDDPELRDAEGDEFPGHLSEKDIRRTRENMLGQKLLKAESYASVVVRSTEIAGAIDQMTVSADVLILGQSHSISFPAIASIANRQLEVSGKMQVTHADLGLKPFSAAFGTLKVGKELVIRFNVVATALDAPL